jgi:hypothetical protein
MDRITGFTSNRSPKTPGICFYNSDFCSRHPVCFFTSAGLAYHPYISRGSLSIPYVTQIEDEDEVEVEDEVKVKVKVKPAT